MKIRKLPFDEIEIRIAPEDHSRIGAGLERLLSGVGVIPGYATADYMLDDGTRVVRIPDYRWPEVEQAMKVLPSGSATPR